MATLAEQSERQRELTKMRWFPIHSPCSPSAPSSISSAPQCCSCGSLPPRPLDRPPPSPSSCAPASVLCSFCSASDSAAAVAFENRGTASRSRFTDKGALTFFPPCLQQKAALTHTLSTSGSLFSEATTRKLTQVGFLFPALLARLPKAVASDRRLKRGDSDSSGQYFPARSNENTTIDLHYAPVGWPTAPQH
jgi:hypothetical protein